jgi:hypothetical protein
MIDKYLSRLEPTGPKGFEGLIASLLSRLTGRQFFLANAGRQWGRDMTSERRGTVAAVECKRYGTNSELDERELQGELTQAVISITDLDLWVLVASRNIPDQIYTALNEAAARFDVEFRTISGGDGSPSSLEALLASSPETVLSFLDAILSEQEKQDVSNSLGQIKAQAEFNQRLSAIKEAFSEQSLGYDHWRMAQNEWLASRFRTENTQAAFGQPLNVAANQIKLIERTAAWQKLDSWLQDWPKTREPFAILGEEGDGKTWAIASWIDRRMLSAEQAPPVVFLSSSQASSNEPFELFSETITRQLRLQSSNFSEKRLERWLRRTVNDVPLILLVLDGINERHRPDWWRKLLEQLRDEPWQDRVAVLITSRADYWLENFGNYRTLSVQNWTLSSYDDVELKSALAVHGLGINDISENLLPFIRKPRYLDIVVRLRKTLGQSGDITLARIIYEDWRDRWERKSATPLSETAFQQIIQELATRKREGIDHLRTHEMGALLSPLGDVALSLDELRSSGILVREGHQYRVDERRLILGFGLLLAEEVRKASLDVEQDFRQVIATWLEPHKEMDLKAAICGYAAYHALVRNDFSLSARVALLRAWLNSHTPGATVEEAFVAYLPLSPESYINLAETVWSAGMENPWAQQLVMNAFLRWKDSPKVNATFNTAFERWLGFVHPNGYPVQRHSDNKNLESVKAEIAERCGHSLSPGPLSIARTVLTVTTDDGYLQLGRVALAVISHLPRKPFVHAIAIGCIADSVMGHPNKGDLISWVLESSSENLWADVEREVDRLLEDGHIVAKQAAHRLLSYEGSSAAINRKQTLPNNLFPPNSLWEQYKRDPCASGFAWRREHCEQCLQRQDLRLSFRVAQANKFCVDPSLQVPAEFIEALQSLAKTIQFQFVWSTLSHNKADSELDDIELACCAFAPRVFAETVRQIFRTSEGRTDVALRQICFQLAEHYPIFLEEEWKVILSSWEKLRTGLQDGSESVQTAECFFFSSVLHTLSASDQLKQLLSRPSNAVDLLSFENNYKPVINWDEIRAILGSISDPTTIRRVLWFISVHPQIVPEDVISHVKSLIEYDDPRIRSTALKILYLVRGSTGRDAVVASTWSWGPKRDPEENHLGSLMLCETGRSIAYTELRSRIHPAYLGFAISKRGSDKKEIEQFAENIDTIWGTVARVAPDLPKDFPLIEILREPSSDAKPFHRIGLSRSDASSSVRIISRDAFWGGTSHIKEEDIEELFNPKTKEQQKSLIKIAREALEEQIEAGNVWFAREFSIETLDEVVMLRPDLVDRWLAPIINDEPIARKLLILARSFYESLCEILLNISPEKGIRLYRQLTDKGSAMRFLASGTRIPIIHYALFRSKPVEPILEAWDSRLKDCKTDRELLEIAIAAQEGGATDWLWRTIKDGRNSNIILNQARSVMLLAFLEGDQSAQKLREQLKSNPETLIDKLVTEVWQLSQNNTWAKYWFSRFLSTGEHTLAWASFRLFLACVDSRFWVWQKDFPKDPEPTSLNHQRWQFCIENFQKIALKTDKNEKRLCETFLLHKILANQVWPWMN